MLLILATLAAIVLTSAKKFWARRSKTPNGKSASSAD